MLMQPWNPGMINRRSSLHEPLTPSMRTMVRPVHMGVCPCRRAVISFSAPFATPGPAVLYLKKTGLLADHKG